MKSELSFDATESFRRKLLLKNLKPFKDDGFNDGSSPGEAGLVLSDLSVVDSDQVETIGKKEGKELLVKNLYGNNGEYGEPVDVNILEILTDDEKRRQIRYPENLVFSQYTPFTILTVDDPTGDNGSLSQDSSLARIGATQLSAEFQYRIGEELRSETLGRVNVLDPNNDVFDYLSIATGNRSVIEKNWNISVPDSLVGKGLDFISRVTGVYSPYSWIQGDIFIYPERKSLVGQVIEGIGNLFSKRNKDEKDLSEYRNTILLNNTGRGSKSVLFDNISFNEYVPNYNLDRLSSIGLNKPNSNYYVGSSNSDPKKIIFPTDELPQNKEGQKVQTAVNGYGILGEEYEGNKELLFFGPGFDTTYDGGGTDGGFVWVSPKYKDDQGKNVGRGGQLIGGSRNNTVSIDGTSSDGIPFKEGSILYDTQKLIESADELTGIKKLRHIGNAIDQVSKVFNDGTRELTKGSRVIRYTDENGLPQGFEYCRVFSKDMPYSEMSNLQKTDGNIRKFESSIFTKTYDLNITPYKNESMKKYMFSLENLAWRTSTKKGYTYQDLARCERGPNGGRVMWFPPYDLSVNESISANWTSNDFIGRPEPIYTYNNTTRQGSLSWKIIVDHPSVLNVMVDKELQNNDNINEIVDSFFAGCRKYDLYELATKFPEFTYSDLYDIITTTTSIPQFETIKEEGFVEKYPEPEEPQPSEPEQPIVTRQDYDFSFYFHNDVPGPQDATSTIANGNYFSHYNSYLALESSYQNYAYGSPTYGLPAQKEPVQTFFDNDIKRILNNAQNLVNKLREALEKGAEVSIKMVGSASAPNTGEYNLVLSKRRIDSVKKFLLDLDGGGGKKLRSYLDDGKLTITDDPNGENITVSTSQGQSVNCTDPLSGYNKTYSINAMACRRVRITDVVETYQPADDIEDWEDEEPLIPTLVYTSNTVTIPKPPKTETTTNLEKTKEVAKKIVRKLLNECNYFERLKEDDPLIYNGIKDKIKYFNPAFHSMTPEGLNTRLTFLQQCMRPGDTIPTIGEDGRPKENTDVSNTSFGAPPVCVLRIGDFFHTKIVISNININYEPLVLDINPEGIGMQPMIANINMNFNFIGGHGLEAPVAKLQNALSFNYYANTEMYDERADVTAFSDVERLNKEVWERIENQTPFGINDRPDDELSQEAGDTIGEVLNTNISIVAESSGTGTTENLTGQIEYKATMADLISQVSDYSSTVNSTFEKIVNRYSISGLKLYTKTRKYTEGKIRGLFEGTTENTNIFGLPIDIQQKTDVIIDGLISDVNNGTSPLLKDIDNEDFTLSEKRQYKKNIKQVFESRRTTWGTMMTSTIDDVRATQEELSRKIDILNLILTKTDGYRVKSGRNFIYSLTGPETLNELNDDLQTIGLDLTNYYNLIEEKIVSESNQYNENFDFVLPGNTDINTPEQVKFFMIFGYEVLNSSQELIDEFLGPLSDKESWSKYVSKIIIGEPDISVDGLEYEYQKIYKLSKNIVSNFEDEDRVKKLKSYNPFNSSKERIFNFQKEITNPVQKENYFNTLYKTVNTGDSDKFNGKRKFN